MKTLSPSLAEVKQTKSTLSICYFMDQISYTIITGGRALDRVHKSGRSVDHQSPNPTLTLTFDLIFIDRRGIVMDYPRANFGNFSFSHFGFIVRTDRITES